eukprot:162230_1
MGVCLTTSTRSLTQANLHESIEQLNVDSQNVNIKSIEQHQQMMNEANIDLDLNVFMKNDICNKDNNNNNNNPIETCNTLKRIYRTMIYYDKLNIFTNHQHKTLFEHFVHEVYYNIINDYIHFNNEHGHQLEQINKQL